MQRNPATKPLEKVPGHSHLFRRGARYYFRIGVPKHLRPILGRRELVKSLDTADFQVALQKISVQEQACREIIQNARVRYDAKENGKAKPKPFEPLSVTSEKHAVELARNWFLELERNGAHWWQENRLELSKEDRNEELADLWHSQAAITGEGDEKVHETDFNDGKLEVRAFLQLHRLKMDERSEGFALLARLFQEARLEYVRRQQDRISGRPIKTYAPLFRDLTENTPIFPIYKTATVKQLTSKYLEEIEKAGKAPKTVSQYGVSANLLCEIFGETRALDSIERNDVERYCTILETLPPHRVKRYSKMSANEAIAEANRIGDKSRLAANTRRNRFFSAFTIFQYAKDTKLISDNPFDDHLLKQRFTPKDDGTEKDVRPFTIEELQKVFAAPLYTGCQDDGRGYGKPGPNVIRRGRFWVPLIGLFHGMRENEICQLHTADVCDWSEGLYLSLVVGEDKRLKNKPSKRAIPVHPELIRLGFSEYLSLRRADTSSPRLFPELTRAKKSGSYSDNFSKWFANFLLKVFGKKIEPTFHSFRHCFTDACRIADLSPQRIDRICGWRTKIG